MTAHLLTWNPRRYPIPDDVYDARRRQVEGGRPLVGRWSTGQSRRVRQGDTVYWLRQGPDRRGLIGSGVAVSDVFQEAHYDRPGRTANYVEHSFDVVLAVDERFETEHLLLAVPRVPWDYLQGSGYRVPEHSEELLAQLWAEHLTELG